MTSRASRPTCRRCRKPLVAVYKQDHVTTESVDLLGHLETSTRVVRGALVGHGYGATDLFCSLTCGHWWAVDRLRAKPALAEHVFCREAGCFNEAHSHDGRCTFHRGEET